MSPYWPADQNVRYVHVPASAADTDRTVEVLATSFAEGRLTKGELDARLGQAFLARFFDELMQITIDLPVGTFGRLPAHNVTPARRRPSRWPAAVAVALGLLVMVAAIAVTA